MLPWLHVAERLESARNYRAGTTRPDGHPHAVPVWAAMVDGVAAAQPVERGRIHGQLGEHRRGALPGLRAGHPHGPQLDRNPHMTLHL